MEMLTSEAKAVLEKQQYRVVGGHSAVKICGWTKHMIKGQGGCYKFKFYGIRSHQCLQMTTSMSCANRCRFCWRDYKSPVSKDWKWDVDEPAFILEGSLFAQKKLLEGFGGNPQANKSAYEASKTVKHVALSLNGEPIIYPKINEMISEFDKNHISTFMVTNGQHPEQIKNLSPVTQLYISLDAPNKELLKDIDVPLFTDFWERLQNSLDAMREKKGRTCIRITQIKGLNDVDLDGYAELIKKGDPDFIEVKGYMHVGASQERLNRQSMPMHEEVVAFSQSLAPLLENYEMMSEHIPSRVVLFAKKKFLVENEWMTWIDFDKYNELVNSDEEFGVEDYWMKTPETFVGLDPRSKTYATRDLRNDPRRSYLKVAEGDVDESDLD